MTSTKNNIEKIVIDNKATKTQQKIIDFDLEKNKNLLISASAGSGKTSTIINRIMNKIVNYDYEITDFLVLTFTKASAEELVQRIQDSFEKIIENNKQNNDLVSRIEIQQRKVLKSYIGTVDSISTMILEQYFQQSGLNPNYKLLEDETEINIIKRNILENVLEKKYISSPNLSIIANNFSNFESGKSNLNKIILKIHDVLSMKLSKEGWFDKNIDELNNKKFDDVNDLSVLKESYFYKNRILDELKNLEIILAQIEKQRSEIDNIFEKNINKEKVVDFMFGEEGVLTSLFREVTSLINIFSLENKKELQWDIFRKEVLDNKIATENKIFDKKKFSEIKKEISEEDFEYLEKIKNEFSEYIKKYKKTLGKAKIKDFFIMGKNENNSLLDYSIEILKTIKEVSDEFELEISNYKEKNNLKEFVDVEKDAIKIIDSDVENQFAGQFKEILVDEFQDINPLQYSLINKISNNNLIMIGDIKQSIYRFRQAEPNLFRNKYNQFKKGDGGKVLELSKNFRSNSQVIDTVNEIFSPIMSSNIGGIDYDKNENESQKLIYGNLDYDNHKLENPVEIINDNFFDDVDEDQHFILSETIKDLLNKDIYDPKIKNNSNGGMRKINYSDIAILKRSSVKDTHDKLSELGIPVMSQGSFPVDFLIKPEINTIINWIKTINNPRDDFALIGLLRSSLFDFNENDLAKIKSNFISKEYEKYSFYDLLILERTKNDEFKNKIDLFLNQLKKYDAISKNNTVEFLINAINQDFSWYEYIGGLNNGKQRQANLNFFIEKSKEYSLTQLSGLHGFIDYINELNNNGKQFEEPLISNESNSVTVSTIHSSKGLEYPVVIFFEDKQFISETESFLVDDVSGISFELLNRGLNISVKPNFFIDAKEKVRLEETSERMRLLYVALTRAQQRLIIIPDNKSKLKKDFNDAFVDEDSIFSDYDILNSKFFFKWISLSLSSSKEKRDLLNIKKVIGRNRKDEKVLEEDDDTKQDFFSNEELKIINHRLSKSKNINSINHTPSTFTATELKSLSDLEDPELNVELVQNSKENGFLVEDEKSLLSIENISALNEFKKPDFMKETSENSIGAKEVGTATHYLLEKINWNRSNLEKEIDEIIADGTRKKILSENAVKKINLDNIYSFSKTDFIKELKNNFSSLKREIPFSFNINFNYKNKINNDISDEVLVMGKIDAYYYDEKNNKIILFDYKTDRKPKNMSIENFKKNIVKKYNNQLDIYSKYLKSVYPTIPTIESYIISLEQDLIIKI